jgi:hypothetical protein
MWQGFASLPASPARRPVFGKLQRRGELRREPNVLSCMARHVHLGWAAIGTDSPFFGGEQPDGDRPMPALPAKACSRTAPIGARYVATVGTESCPVRAMSVWPIEEVLGLEVESVLMASIEEDAAVGPVVSDLLESRMIVPLRPRRRRERAVSSRAHFYAGNEG